MENPKYKVVAKQVSGVKTVGFTIENSDGHRKNIDKSDTVKLARSGKLANAVSVYDSVNGEYLLDIENGLADLEKADMTKGIELKIIGRLVDDNTGKCIGYKTQDKKGKIYKLSISKVWDLAEQGSIDDLRAQIFNNSRVLIGINGLKLSQLPIIKTNINT